MSSDAHVRLSKALSLLLRHDPARFGVELDSEGWADVAAVLRGLNAAGLGSDEVTLREVVRDSDKQRFELSRDAASIRARQGHSIDVDLGLDVRDPPEMLYHGTVARFLPSIRAGGLRPKQRQHVHLSPSRALADEVGARRGDPVILEIRAGDMHRDGHTFHCSTNGVWLTAHVPPQYLSNGTERMPPMAITFSNDISGLSPDHLVGFFEGWPDPPVPAAHLAILRGSHAVWLAFDGERCVGFVNAISDGVFYAHVPLLEVLPDYRGRGIGAELVRRMTETLGGMYAIDVLCDESVAPFYDALGFTRCVGMARRNYENQSAADAPSCGE